MATCIEKGLAEHVHVLANGIWTSVPEANMSSKTNGDRVGGGGNFNERRWVNASDATAYRYVSELVGKGHNFLRTLMPT
jgi:hypothetical protein